MTPPPPDGARAARTVAVVPLRDGVSGKSRLATALDPAARRRLIAALARHVVGVLTDAAGIDRVLVVTADVPFVTDLFAAPLERGSSSPVRQFELPHPSRTAAPGAQIEVVPQPSGRPGLNAAVDVGREHATTLGADTLLVVHADLPVLSTDDVAALLAVGAATVVVATDRHDSGTNLLRVPLTGPEPYRTRFGPGSRAAHVAEAGRLGLPSVVVRRPGTAVDLDTLDDWAELPDDVRDHLRDVVGHTLM